MNIIYCKVESRSSRVIASLKNMLGANLTTTDDAITKSFRSFPRFESNTGSGDTKIIIIESSDWFVSFAITNTNLTETDLKYITDNWNDVGSIEYGIKSNDDERYLEGLETLRSAISNWECTHQDPQMSYLQSLGNNGHCQKCTEILEAIKIVVGTSN